MSPPHKILDPIHFRLFLAGIALLAASVLNAFYGISSTWVMAVGMMLALEVLITATRIRRRDSAKIAEARALEAMVSFLESLNRISTGIPFDGMHQQLVALLQQTLRPIGVHSRLWLANKAWKTLRGHGEHPAVRPGSPSHLPITACPAFALGRPYEYQKGHSEACPSEQFHYAKHLCQPVSHEQDTFGVLFLSSDSDLPWSDEEIHFFTMMTHAMALTLQRKATFDHLEEKIKELRVSFEVGTTSLATFVGSTQSLDETTIHVLDGVLSMLQVDRASLMLWDPLTRRLRTQWVRGGDFTIRSPLSLAMGEGMAGWALQSGQPYWAEYATGDPHYQPSAQTIQSLLCFPMYTVDQQPLGVINAVTVEKPRTFSEQEVRFLLAFARQAAMAIENAQLHQKNRANIDQLHELNTMKSQFLSLVSHDLRGPLTGIRGFAEILKEQTAGPLNDAQLEMLEQMEKQVEHQERMVDDLLDFARMEKGNFSIHLNPTDLLRLLKEEVDKSQRDARDRGLTLTLVVPEEGLSVLSIDEGRIRQILWNLIHNSLKFTPPNGRVVVRARNEDASIRIEVEDSGVGLSADTQSKIFEKFFQVTPGGSKGAQGLGLGLAICREIVHAHRGKIFAQSPGLGLGTTISFTLPRQFASEQTNETSSMAA